MRNLFCFISVVLLLVTAFGCRKEKLETPQEAEPLLNVDPVIEAENIFSQLFSVATYAQYALAVPNTASAPACSTPTFFSVPGGYGLNIDFDNCTLAPGLVVDGTIDFQLFGSNSPSTNPTPGNPVNTQLFFNNIVINGRSIQNLSTGSFVEFRDIADPVAGYDLFEVVSPQTFRVTHVDNPYYTDFIPFETFDVPDAQKVHLKLKIAPSISTNFTDNTAEEILDDLFAKEFTLKIEKKPSGFDMTNSNLDDDFWRANTYPVSGGSIIQSLQLITQSDPAFPADDIEGLSFSLQCGYFKGGTLITSKAILADFGGGLSPICYYPFESYDFGYNMMPGDEEGDAIDCTATGAVNGDCDIWAIRKSFGDCSSTICSVCQDISPANRPLTCTIVKCFGVE